MALRRQYDEVQALYLEEERLKKAVDKEIREICKERNALAARHQTLLLQVNAHNTTMGRHNRDLANLGYQLRAMGHQAYWSVFLMMMKFWKPLFF